MSENDKALMANVMESFVSEMPAQEFVTSCVVCNKGVIREDMKYEKGRVFHNECYEKHGGKFLVVNQDLEHQNAMAKIELVQLKNLKIRRNSERKKSRKTKSKPKRKKSKRTKPKRKIKVKQKQKTRTKSKRKTKRRKVKKRTRVKRTSIKRKKPRTKGKIKSKRVSRRKNPSRKRR